MGNLILGADFSHQPIVGWELPHADRTTLTPSPTSELRLKADPGTILSYALNSLGFFDDVDTSVNITFYEGNLGIIHAGIMVGYQADIGGYDFHLS